MQNTDQETEKWRRRERGLALGVVLWAVNASLLATVHPELIAEWLQSSATLEIAGYLMISLGFAGGFGTSVMHAMNRWATSHYDQELTEWNDV